MATTTTLPFSVNASSITKVRTPTVRVDSPDGALNENGTPKKIDLAGGDESWEGGDATFTSGLFKGVGIKLKKVTSFKVNNSPTVNAYYLNEAGLSQKQNLAFRGVTLTGADLKVNSVTNHPTITGSTSKWTGRVRFSADGLKVGNLPLSLAAPTGGGSALSGSYNFLTKTVEGQINGITFDDGRLRVVGGGSVKISQSRINAAAARVDVAGQATLSLLKQNVLDAMTGTMTLRLENNTVSGFQINVQKSDKLRLNGPLTIKLQRDPSNNRILSGSVQLKDGVTLGSTGIGLAGSLNFVRGTTTNPDAGVLKGTLSVNNSKLIPLSYGDFSLTPKSGSVAFSVTNSTTSATPDVDFSFKSLVCDLTLLGKTVSLSGDLDLRYVDSKPQFVGGALTLLNDVTWSMKDSNGNDLSLTLKGTTSTSTTPTRISLGESISDRTYKNDGYPELVTGKPALKFSGTVIFSAAGYNLPATIKTLEFDPSQTVPSYRWYFEAGIGTSALMRQTDPVTNPAPPALPASGEQVVSATRRLGSGLPSSSVRLVRPASGAADPTREARHALSPTAQLLAGMTVGSTL